MNTILSWMVSSYELCHVSALSIALCGAFISLCLCHWDIPHSLHAPGSTSQTVIRHRYALSPLPRLFLVHRCIAIHVNVHCRCARTALFSALQSFSVTMQCCTKWSACWNKAILRIDNPCDILSSSAGYYVPLFPWGLDVTVMLGLEDIISWSWRHFNKSLLLSLH